MATSLSVVVSILLAFVFLGLPFYWGTLGHHGYVVPTLWAIAVALAVNLRHWRHIDGKIVGAFLVTLLVSLVVCLAVFSVGRVLGQDPLVPLSP